VAAGSGGRARNPAAARDSQTTGANDRRDEILRAASALFNERGYHRTSMNDIGELIGLTGPAVYHYFEGKERILSQLVDHSLQVLDELGAAAEDGDHLDAGAQLELLVRAYAHRAVSDHNLIGLWLINSKVLEGRDRARWARAQRMYREEWVHAFHQVRPELGDAEARVLVTAAFFAINSLAFFRSGLAPEHVEELIYSAAMAALLRSDAPPVKGAGSRRRTRRTVEPPGGSGEVVL
jgi:AcrR family transcriptional regulator